ncbi:adenylate/guanylate cyclase domain-containing protein [Methylogaea oryzae]|uniref:adenylate/guanylate cyclase domain-containing protein n=1 Tax=Methylogaea oryzae TaxID=1295382 RepID=UPI0006D167D2|nr:adenylate/guanylate cyclase domain-containing protein [Methylogaea oryzae]
MSQAETEATESTPLGADDDIEKLLAERQRLEAAFEEKFKRAISVMFTDLKGSTAITEKVGDLAARDLMKRHNDIFFPIVEKNGGVVVKTMGDGTMSYFNTAQEAARTAVAFQKALAEYNLGKPQIPIEVTIGIHTGIGIVEKNDIYGDVVNVAARFESQAPAGGIAVSEDTYNALEDRTEIYCRFVRMARLKGKSDEFKVFKIFWDPKEIEEDRQNPTATLPSSGAPAAQQKKSNMRLFIALGVMLAAVSPSWRPPNGWLRAT